MTKWLAGVLALLTGAIVLSCSQRREITPEQFAALPRAGKNLAIFDAFRAHLDAHYFDQKALKSPQMQAVLDEYRSKAAAAKDANLLYFDVFVQLQQKFPHSHVNAAPPQAPANATPAVQRSNALMLSGPGFDIVGLRREKAGVVFIVGEVEPRSPAARAGVAPGSVIDRATQDATTDPPRFSGQLRQLTATQVEQNERRASYDVPPDVTAETVDAYVAAHTVKHEYDLELLPSRAPFESKTLPGGIAYLRFDTFADVPVVDSALAAIDRAGPRGLILDLRRNTGGKVSEVRRVLGRLIGPDAYIGTFRTANYFENMRTDAESPTYRGPLVVLTGPMTASGGEVTASAVKDSRRGKLIGRMTNGSVLSSQGFPLPDGGLAQIPMMDFVRGGDRRIEGVGVEVDVFVLPTIDDIRAGRDVALERALAELTGG